MFLTEKKIKTIIKKIISESSGGQNITKIYQEDQEIVEFLDSILAATSPNSSETGFGNKFESILLKHLFNHMSEVISNPEPLNVEGSTATEFADILDYRFIASPANADMDANSDGVYDPNSKIYYSVKTSFYDETSGQVGESHIKKAKKLAEKVYNSFYNKPINSENPGLGEEGYHPQYIEMCLGLIACHINLKLTRENDYKGIGMTIRVVKPGHPNYALHYNPLSDTYTNYLLKSYSTNVTLEDGVQSDASPDDNEKVEITDNDELISNSEEASNDLIDVDDASVDKLDESSGYEIEMAGRVAPTSAKSFLDKFCKGVQGSVLKEYDFILYPVNQAGQEAFLGDTSLAQRKISGLAMGSAKSTIPRVTKTKSFMNDLINDSNLIIANKLSELDEIPTIGTSGRLTKANALRFEYREALKKWKSCMDNADPKGRVVLNYLHFISSMIFKNPDNYDVDAITSDLKRIIRGEELSFDPEDSGRYLKTQTSDLDLMSKRTTGRPKRIKDLAGSGGSLFNRQIKAPRQKKFFSLPEPDKGLKKENIEFDNYQDKDLELDINIEPYFDFLNVFNNIVEIVKNKDEEKINQILNKVPMSLIGGDDNISSEYSSVFTENKAYEALLTKLLYKSTK